MNSGFNFMKQRQNFKAASGPNHTILLLTKSNSIKPMGKIMASVLWDREVRLSTDWLPKKTIINSYYYYLKEVQKSREAIKREQRKK